MTALNYKHLHRFVIIIVWVTCGLWALCMVSSLTFAAAIFVAVIMLHIYSDKILTFRSILLFTLTTLLLQELFYW